MPLVLWRGITDDEEDEDMIQEIIVNSPILSFHEPIEKALIIVQVIMTMIVEVLVTMQLLVNVVFLQIIRMHSSKVIIMLVSCELSALDP